MGLKVRATTGQRIYIGDTVVTLVDASRGVAKLDIDAPDGVTVDREKVRQAKEMMDEVNFGPDKDGGSR